VSAVTLALDTDRLGLSFLRGMVAAVNPCAFVLLPAYLMFFLGLEGAQPGSQRASVRRALVVSAAMSAGFIAVFVAAGGVFELGTSWLNRNSKYATVGIGLALIVLGGAMLFGYKLPFATPRLDVAARGRLREDALGSMFVYGVAYAVASIGCTLPLFISTVFGPGRVLEAVANAAAYGLGMGLLVTALTVTLAVANTGLLRVVRSGTRYVELVAAAFVMLAGAYLVYYFWVVDVNGESDGVTGAVERFQIWVTNQLDDRWQVAAVVLTVIVGTALVFVSRGRRSSRRAGVGSPASEG
jgi:cytochrome c biogenesis protein CcdA